MADLPEEIINLVLKRLCSIEDFVRSEAVCKLWQSVVVSLKKKKTSFNHPWMMLPNNDNVTSFFCLSSKSVFNFKFPHIRDMRCWGSPYGWVVTFGLDLNIGLLNPFSKLELSLPPQSSFDNQYNMEVTPTRLRKSFVLKFVLSSSPSSNKECIVVAIYAEYRTLAFAKPGDEAWTPIDSHDVCCFQDVILFKGQFYAANNTGKVVVCEINTPHPRAKQVAPPPEKFNPINKAYLIELSGELLLIERVINGNKKRRHLLCGFHYVTKFFVVYKLDVHNKRWEKIFDLGEYALFLGGNTSFAVSTAEYPEYKRNSIYFTDDHFALLDNKFCDMGVFDFGGKAKPPTPIYSSDNMFSDFFRPTFLVPNF
ncbi:SWR1-complex protein 3 [Ranunculus cassubicifolius]